jgi:NitT/TauT family transport system permease protein
MKSIWIPKNNLSRKNFISQLSPYRNKTLYGIIGIIILLVGWQVLSVMFHKMIVASPLATLKAFLNLAGQRRTWEYILITFERLLLGLFFGSMVGSGLGLVAGLNPGVRLVLEPLRWVATTVPAVVIAIVAMLWFGMGSSQVIFVAIIITAPITYINVSEGVLAIDKKIIEMGSVFNFSRRMFLTQIYLPGIGASIMAGFTLTVGMGVRVVVLSELMGAHEGIGHGFSRAWTHLDTPELFAWILMSLTLMGILEFGILKPIRSRLMRWKGRI